MADEDAFGDAVGSIGSDACPFGQAIHAGCAACPLADRVLVAERELMTCRSPADRDRCIDLHEAIRRRSPFALGLARLPDRMTHAQELRIQCGGVAGIAGALQGSHEDVRALSRAASQRDGGLDALPWPVVMQSIAAFVTRRKRGPAA